MDNQDKTTFSLDDDEEIIEESFTERDEEYDDDEDYDDDYDDEEDYDDEDYDDEEYDDDYDDGYNDNYYDDRLNKVLDEIAELKRGMAPAPVQQQLPPVIPPQYIYQPTQTPAAGSEVVMYNEISRLRDELAKNTSSLEMQKELTRMKEDMTRDQKIVEAQYHAEIERLQNRIDDLLKNGSSPQGELPAAQEPARIEGAQSIPELDKLLSINEAILRATGESDARIQGEISKLKKQLEDMPSMKELNSAVSSVKKAANSGGAAVAPDAVAALISDMTALRSALKCMSGINSASSDVNASELLRQLYDIKLLLGNTSEQAEQHVAAVRALVNEYKKLSSDVRSQAVSYKDKLVAAYDFAKKLTNGNDPETVDLLGATSELIAELNVQPLTRAVFADIQAYCSANGIMSITPVIRDNAERFFGLAEKIVSATVETYPQYLPDIVNAVNVLENNSKNAANAELVEKVTKILLEENIDAEAREKARNLVNDLISLTVADLGVLPKVENSIAYNIPAEEENSESKATLFAKLDELRTTVLDAVAALTQSVQDVQAAQAAQAEQAEKAEQAMQAAQAEQAEKAEQAVQAAVAQAVEAAQAAISARESEKTEEDNGEKAKAEEVPQQPVQTFDSEATEKLLSAIDELKTQISELNLSVIASSESVSVDNDKKNDDEDNDSVLAQNLSSALEELRGNYLDISGKLVDISEKIQEPVAVDAPVMDDADKQKTLDELEYIRRRMEEYSELVSQIPEIRADILAFNPTPDIDISEPLAEQANTLIAEMNSQFDKLYEDLSNVIIESEANIINRIGETGDGLTADSLEAVKAEILSDTQAIKDLIAANDASSGIADAVEQLRADVAAYTDNVNGNADAAATDRQKLLDDIAFLREQAELAMSEDDIPDGAAAVQDSEKFAEYLDDIASRVTLLPNLADDVTLVKDSVVGLNDNIAALGENLANINDNLAVVSDTVRPMSEDILAARDAATATLDALTPIADQLNSLLDRLDAEQAEYDAEQSIDEGEATLADDELSAIKDDLNTLLDTLPLFPQADDLIAARDNTYTILDTLATMPLADDLALVRDNVVTILDAVNALTESVQAASGASIDNDELAVLHNAVDTTAEDVRYIREKLEANTEAQGGENLDGILQELGNVMDKLEQYEVTSVNNKQEIIDTVNGIREEFHINTLDENMTAAGMDGETRDALVGEISEIRERLGAIESTTQSLDTITEQLMSLQALIEDNSAAAQYDEGAQGEENYDDMSADNMQVLIDELAAIREKLDAQPEYDTVEEILSLRDDVKAARIVDQDEVSGELESIKNELAAISSGNILDEIRALREDLINLPTGEGASAPTDGEINLVLNEIVSLRDEVFAFKDEVINATALGTEQPEQTEIVDAEEDITTILDELTALRADQTALNENVGELKDIISRRTSIGVAEGEDPQDGVAANAGMDVVLDEIINLKNDIERIEESVGGDRFAAMTEQVDEIRAMLDELRMGATAEAETVTDESVDEQSVSIDLTPIMEQFDALNAAIDDIRLNQGGMDGDDSAVGTMTVAERFDELHNEIDDIKLAIDDILDATSPRDYSAEIDELRAEVEALRAENEQLRQDNTDVLSVQLAELKDAIHDMALTMTPPVATDGGDTSYAALIDEIRELGNRIDSQQAPVSTSLDEETLQAIRDTLGARSENTYQGGLSEELSEIRDEIAQLRSLTTVSAESEGSAEIAALRDELREIKQLLSSSDSLTGVAEDVTAIKADVQTLKEEPDLGVMSEILALRDEFQALREQIEDVKRVAGKTDKDADDTIMNEVQSLRDQLFAISMANVNDPGTGESNYESYNNIILDEIASLRDQVTTAGSASDIAAVADELSQLKATIDRREDLYDALSERVSKLNNDVTNNRILDELESLRDQVTTAGSASDIAAVADEVSQLKAAIDKREDLYDALSERVYKLNNDVTNNRILDELASLRTDMSNQRDADLTTLNFMSEMAHLLERQNQYLTQNAGSKITDEIESLKAEIASSDAVAEEVAKLREVITQSGGAADNESILNELADLREELSQEKPSQANALILDAIARLRDEVTVLAEREKIRDLNSDADLSDSLSDLKYQLNEIAGIIGPDDIKPEEKKPEPKEPKQEKKPVAKSNGTGAKRGRKPGSKNASTGTAKKASASSTASTGTGAKRGRKPAANKTEKPVVKDGLTEDHLQTVVLPPRDEFEAHIDEQASMLGGNDSMSLNTNLVTADAMDLADKLAKQVANKLIMEQLVEQLGDGGVSEERVDEILRDILPQEFTTIAETEASDKVRRLANQLVLDKLRSRLNGKKNDEY